MTATAANLKTIRWDHTGALRRPDWLRELGYRYSEGQASTAELRDAQDRAIRELVAKEEAAGLPVVTDGEARRAQFQESFGGAVEGYDHVLPYKYQRPGSRSATPVGRQPSGMPGPGPAVAHRLPARERLRLVRNLILEEYQYASSVSSTPVKVTLIGPDRISQRFEWENSSHVYKDMDDFVADVVAIEREMIRQVVEAGCRYVQLDEPGYTAYVDEISLEAMKARGEDPMRNLARSIEADNAVMAGFPGVTFGVHICRGGGGGRGGRFHRQGHYDPIAEQLFSELQCDRFLLEYDSDEAGGFEPLRYVPKDKVAMLGLVCNNTPDVETAEYLKRRLEEASQYLPLEQASIGPRCGMGSLDEDVMWAKLRVIREVAEEVWGKPGAGD